MRIKKDFKVIIFFLILSLFCNISIFTQNTKVKDDKKDKEKKEKIEKEKKEKNEKEEKNKDIKEKLPKIKDQLETNSIVSEKIHTERKETDNRDVNKNISDDYTEKNSQIKNFTKTFEDLQIKSDDMVRNIKQSTPENVASVKDQYDTAKNLIENIEKEDVNFFNNLSEEEKELINQQSVNIQNSRNNLSRILINLDKEFDKKNKNMENIFDKIKEFEKEVRIIYRQYRAIEWILFE